VNGVTDGSTDVPDDDPPALRGTGAHLDADELFTWTRFLDASRLVEERIARHLSDDHAMTHSDFEVLVRLDGAGGALRLSALAEQCVWSRSRLSHTLDRLEARGWIERRPVPEDQRGFDAVLTEPGWASLAEAAGPHAELIREILLLPLTASERSTLGAAMDRIARALRDRRGVE
jgi:DNA-binding MarR family transcriptional regulator